MLLGCGAGAGTLLSGQDCAALLLGSQAGAAMLLGCGTGAATLLSGQDCAALLLGPWMGAAMLLGAHSASWSAHAMITWMLLGWLLGQQAAGHVRGHLCMQGSASAVRRARFRCACAWGRIRLSPFVWGPGLAHVSSGEPASCSCCDVHNRHDRKRACLLCA